jgi:hypothetical protein
MGSTYKKKKVGRPPSPEEEETTIHTEPPPQRPYQFPIPAQSLRKERMNERKKNDPLSPSTNINPGTAPLIAAQER